MINLSLTIKRALIVIGIVMILWLLWIVGRDWLKPNIIKGLGGYTNSEMKHTTDTLSIKYNNIFIKYKELEVKAQLIGKPEYISVYKYIKEQNTNDTSTTGKVQPQITTILGVKRYQTIINDTILQGNIETILSLDSCKIVSQTLKYQPKIPYIREKIVTIVNNTETILSDKPKAYIGAGINVSSNNQITPQVLYLTKKKWLYNIGYQKDITNQLPNTIQIGVAKLF